MNDLDHVMAHVIIAILHPLKPLGVSLVKDDLDYVFQRDIAPRGIRHTQTNQLQNHT